MHDKYWAQIGPKVRDGGLVMVNEATFGESLEEARYRVVRLAATDIAASLGNELGGSLVMLGAFLATTGLVELDPAIEGMRESIPSYRTQHIAANEVALRAGWQLLPANEAPAWEEAARV